MDLQMNAPWRLWSFIVNFWQHKRPHFPRSRPKSTALPSAHIARDIGLSPADAERLNIKWPSQSVRHPYL